MFAAEYASRVSSVMATTVHLEVCTHAELKNVMFSFTYLSVCLFVKGLQATQGREFNA